MMTGNTAIHIASQLQSGAPRKAAFLVAVRERSATSFFSLAFSSSSCFNRRSKAGRGHHRDAEVVPRQGKVIQTVREKFSCREDHHLAGRSCCTPISTA